MFAHITELWSFLTVAHPKMKTKLMFTDDFCCNLADYQLNITLLIDFFSQVLLMDTWWILKAGIENISGFRKHDQLAEMVVIFSRDFCKQSCYSYRRFLTGPEQIFWQQIDSWTAWGKHFRKCCVLTQSKVFYIVDELSSCNLQKSDFCDFRVPWCILCVPLAGIH